MKSEDIILFCMFSCRHRKSIDGKFQLKFIDIEFSLFISQGQC